MNIHQKLVSNSSKVVVQCSSYCDMFVCTCVHASMCMSVYTLIILLYLQCTYMSMYNHLHVCYASDAIFKPGACLVS